jgi:hypothetical protein
MCTVTYIPLQGRVFITSNRDEQTNRHTAKPAFHLQHGIAAVYATDHLGNGTWCGVNEIGHIVVLLNGAREKHIARPPYRQSRGLVVKQLLHQTDLLAAVSGADLQGIEPFTLVLYTGRQLYELVWDGVSKTIAKLPAYQPHLWASATLYKPVAKQRKQEQLERWLPQGIASEKSIEALHRQMRYETSLPETQQVPGMRTVSISVLSHNGNGEVCMHHQSLLEAKNSVCITFPIKPSHYEMETVTPHP